MSPSARRLTLAAAVATGLVGLGACGDPAPSTGPAAPEPPAEAPAPPAAPPAAGDRLADAVVGTFDETAAACAEPTTMARLTVSQDTLAFYYGYATVDAVTPRDGGYDVGATLYQLEGAVEVVPEPITYRIEPRDGGVVFGSGLERGEPSPLVRCDRP